MESPSPNPHAATTNANHHRQYETPCKWLTTDQVQRKLNISQSTIYRWRRLGVLRGYHLTGTRNIYFLESEVDAFLRQNAIAPSGRLDSVWLQFENSRL